MLYQPDCTCLHCTERGYCRHPKTTNEKRRAGRRGRGVDGTRVRAKRSTPNLADAWDDLIVPRYRGWKERGKYKRQWEKNFNPPIPCRWSRWDEEVDRLDEGQTC